MQCSVSKHHALHKIQTINTGCVGLDVRSATQNFREFARNNMNTYFKS